MSTAKEAREPGPPPKSRPSPPSPRRDSPEPSDVVELSPEGLSKAENTDGIKESLATYKAEAIDSGTVVPGPVIVPAPIDPVPEGCDVRYEMRPPPSTS